MPRSSRVIPILALVVLLAAGAVGHAAAVPQATPTPPAEFFGHELGADRTLARWDRIVEYLELLESQSDRMRLVNLGPSTEGHPFLLAIISSPDNLANLDRLSEISRNLADPRGFTEAEIESMIAEGKAVVAQSLGLHSTEVAGAQSGPAIAYDFLSRNDEEARRILDETILLLLPCINPDGQIMVTDWYRETLGTPAEGMGLPWLYHRYGGHDNNRDGDYLNMQESKYIAEVLYREWKPQAYVDHHQMGSYGARLYIPPYTEPIRPGADPLIWREIAWYGAHMATVLEQEGIEGVLNAAQYPGWGHFGWHWITPFHNIAGMLTESASASLATPLYIHPDQLRGGARQFPEYEAQSTMPSPWEGGWWRVADIVKQQRISAWALQDLAARDRETVLRNAYLKAKRQIEAGKADETRAFVVPNRQHDPLTAAKMIDTLLQSDVEVHRATSEFSIDAMLYEAGSFVVPMAQPKRGLVMNLLGRTRYPDNEWTRDREGNPLRPYDTSTHTMAELMGVRVDPVEMTPDGEFERLSGRYSPEGSVAGAEASVLDGRLNAAFHAANLLLERGVAVSRVAAAGGDLRPGDFVVEGASAEDLEAVATATGVTFATQDASSARTVPIGQPRIGMYQRYGGGNMDEGWTRMVLESFGFPYTSVMDQEIQAGNLIDSYDVLLFPHDSPSTIVGDGPPSRWRPGYPEPFTEYNSAIGEAGVEALKAFVEAGGRLVLIGGSTGLAGEYLGLNVRDAVEGLPSREFFAPGSTLRVRYDVAQPMAWGMPEEGYALFWDTPVLEIVPSRHNDDYVRVGVYQEEEILRSGWVIGEERLADKGAAIAARMGQGTVHMIAVRAQHRAQTHGTFKLLFNGLFHGVDAGAEEGNER